MNIYAGYTLLTLWMLVIFLFSAQVADTSSAQSGAIVDIVKQLNLSASDELLTFLTRKSAHIIAYFILGFLTFNLIRYYGVSKKWLLLGVVIAGSYAISDEIHQTFIEGRSGEVRDVLIDTMAASAGIGGLYLYKRRQIDTTSDKMV